MTNFYHKVLLAIFFSLGLVSEVSAQNLQFSYVLPSTSIYSGLDFNGGDIDSSGTYLVAGGQYQLGSGFVGPLYIQGFGLNATSFYLPNLSTIATGYLTVLDPVTGFPYLVLTVANPSGGFVIKNVFADMNGNLFYTYATSTPNYASTPINMNPFGVPADNVYPPVSNNSSFYGGFAKISTTTGYVWSKTLKTTNSSPVFNIYNSTIDNNGDVIIVGSFNGSVDFNLGGIPVVRTSVGSGAISPDGFVAKYSGVTGSLIWVNQYGGTLGGDAVTMVTVDPISNNIAIFSKETNIFKGIKVLDSAGNTIQSFSLGTASIDSNGLAFRSGELVMAGYFSGTVNLGTDSSGAVNVTNTNLGTNEGILVAYDTGTSFVLWHKELPTVSVAPYAHSYFNQVVFNSCGDLVDFGHWIGNLPGYGISSTTYSSFVEHRDAALGNISWTNIYSNSAFDIWILSGLKELNTLSGHRYLMMGKLRPAGSLASYNSAMATIDDALCP